MSVFHLVFLLAALPVKAYDPRTMLVRIPVNFEGARPDGWLDSCDLKRDPSSPETHWLAVIDETDLLKHLTQVGGGMLAAATGDTAPTGKNSTPSIESAASAAGLTVTVADLAAHYAERLSSSGEASDTVRDEPSHWKRPQLASRTTLLQQHAESRSQPSSKTPSIFRRSSRGRHGVWQLLSDRNSSANTPLFPEDEDADCLKGTMGGYPTYDEVKAWIASMQTDFPSLVSQPYTLSPKSVFGNVLPSFVISSDTDTPKKKLLLMSLLHAREPSGLISLLYFCEYVAYNYGRLENITALLDGIEMHVVPVANPDGYIFNSQTAPGGGGMQRKNRRQQTSCSGTARGVDLNRNFGYAFAADNTGSSGDACASTYRGSGAFSEPETRAIRDLVDGMGPFKSALSFHAYGNLLVFPCNGDGSESNIDVEDCVNNYMDMSIAATGANGYTYGTSADTVGYAVNGDAGQWLDSVGVWTLTPEVGTATDGFWPTHSRAIELARNNVPMVFTVANYARQDLPSGSRENPNNTKDSTAVAADDFEAKNATSSGVSLVAAVHAASLALPTVFATMLLLCMS